MHTPEPLTPRRFTMMMTIDTRAIGNITFVVRNGMLQILLTHAEQDPQSVHERPAHQLIPAQSRQAAGYQKNMAPRSHSRLTAK